MPLIDLPLRQPLTIRVNNTEAEYQAEVLDQDAETCLLRVPIELSDVQPHRVTFRMGYDNAYWEIPADALATYGGWWFVSRPQEQAGRRVQRRAFVRILYQGGFKAIPLARDGQQAEPVQIESSNLSAGGMLASSRELVATVGDEMMVFLQLPDQAPISTLAEVVRAEPKPFGPHRYGLSFKYLSEPVQERMHQFVNNEIRRGLRQGRDITVAA